jgi:group II intron reverse transcriptase/maturase
MRLIDRILQPENMREAWEDVQAKKGAPGVDGVTIKRWRRNWEERLVNLAAAVRANTYKPSRLRYRWIPKKGGGRRKISVLTVTDKVLQRAVLQVLTNVFERRFLSCSYGYRPKRSLYHAVGAIIRYRDRGFKWLLDADIDSFFDSIDNQLLMSFVREDVKDPLVLRLIEDWLKVHVGEEERPKGIPLGAVISPLLSNVYLHRLDCALVQARWPLVRYADDLVALARSEARAWQARGVVADVLAELLLGLNDDKTRVASFEKGFDFLGVRFYRDQYSYLWEDKRIKVKGDFTWLFYQYGPEGYT